MLKDGKALGGAALVAAALGISASAVLNKLAMSAGLHPIWVNVFRLGFALVVMAPFFAKNREAVRAVVGVSRRDGLLMLLSGVFLGIHFASWATALAYTDSVVAVTVWSTFSLMTVVGSSLLLNERTPLPALLGLLLAVCGVGICAVGASGAQLFGFLMALSAAVMQAGYTLCGRAVRKRIAMLPYTMVVYSVAFCCMLGAALVLRLPTNTITWNGVGVSLLLALVCTLGGHSSQNYALKFFKAPTVSAAILTEVFTGPMLVFLFLGEVPKLMSVLGGVVILIGVGWYMLYEWRFAPGVPANVKRQKHGESV